MERSRRTGRSSCLCPQTARTPPVSSSRQPEAGAGQEAKVIFDTDVLVWATRGNLRAARIINDATDRELSIVSLMELVQGARSKLDIRQILQTLRLLQFRILPLSESI